MDDKEEKEIHKDNSKYIEVVESGNEHKQSFAVLGKKDVKVTDKEPQGDGASLREKGTVVVLKTFDAVAKIDIGQELWKRRYRRREMEGDGRREERGRGSVRERSREKRVEQEAGMEEERIKYIEYVYITQDLQVKLQCNFEFSHRSLCLHTWPRIRHNPAHVSTTRQCITQIKINVAKEGSTSDTTQCFNPKSSYHRVQLHLNSVQSLWNTPSLH